jgi:ParB family chromosome partitioning protein
MKSTPSSIKDFAPIPVDSIKIGRRFRKDLGDIASLAEDIRQIGLLHPIVIKEVGAQSGRRDQLTSANQIAEDNKIKQLEKQLDERNRELSAKMSPNHPMS